MMKRLVLLLGLTGVVLGSLTDSVSADVLYWMDGWTGDWNGDNWWHSGALSVGAGPTASDDAYAVDTGTTYIGQIGAPATAVANSVTWSGGNPQVFMNDAGSSLTAGGITLGAAAGASAHTATLTQNAGTINASSWISLGQTADATGTYLLNGGTLDVAGYGGSIGEHGTGALTQTNGSVVVHANGGETFNIGRFEGASGSYTISGGSLHVNNGENNALNIGAGGAGILHVIGAAATLTDDGALVEGGSGTLAFDVNGNSGSGALGVSALTVGGDVSLGGALQISLVNGSSLLSSYTLINKTSSGAITGAFTGLPDGSLFDLGGKNYVLSYSGGDGNDVTLVQTPEPGSLSLLIAGLLAVLTCLWRRHSY